MSGSEQAFRPHDDGLVHYCIVVARPERAAFMRIVLGFHPSDTPALSYPYIRVQGR